MYTYYNYSKSKGNYTLPLAKILYNQVLLSRPRVPYKDRSSTVIGSPGSHDNRYYSNYDDSTYFVSDDAVSAYDEYNSRPAASGTVLHFNMVHYIL